MFYDPDDLNRAREGGPYEVCTQLVGDYEEAQTLAVEFVDKYERYLRGGPPIVRGIRRIRAQKAAEQLTAVARRRVASNAHLYYLELDSGVLEPDILYDSSLMARDVLSGSFIEDTAN